MRRMRMHGYLLSRLNAHFQNPNSIVLKNNLDVLGRNFDGIL
jgi:hypothetical protein